MSYQRLQDVTGDITIEQIGRFSWSWKLDMGGLMCRRGVARSRAVAIRRAQRNWTQERRRVASREVIRP